MPKNIDLNKAKVADGALAAPKSVYEMVGLSDGSYQTGDFEKYKDSLETMNLIELQDHAYKIGVLAAADRDILVDRLERKFLQEQNRFVPQVENQKSTASKSIQKQAAEIMRRGR